MGSQGTPLGRAGPTHTKPMLFRKERCVPGHMIRLPGPWYSGSEELGRHLPGQGGAGHGSGGQRAPIHGCEDSGGAQGHPDGTDPSLRKATVLSSGQGHQSFLLEGTRQE